MKNFFTLLFFFFSICKINAQTTYPTGASGCVARWDFTSNGTFNTLPDVSGNNNNGSASNISAGNGWRNQANKSGAFNGLNSNSIVPNSSTLTPSTFTIISLVKFNDFNSAPCNASQIVSKGEPYFIAGNYGMCVSDNYFDQSCNIYSPNNMQLTMQAQNQANSPIAGNYIQKNKWYFFAATFDNISMKNYQTIMDSTNMLTSITPFQTLNSSMPLGSNIQDLSIGFHLNPSYPYWFNGNMDELAIFNRVLNDDEIYSIYRYLYGYPTSIKNVSEESIFNITNNNESVNIETNEQNYNIILRSVIGDVIYKKNGCNNTENIDISIFAKQPLLIEISTINKRVIKKI